MTNEIGQNSIEPSAQDTPAGRPELPEKAGRRERELELAGPFLAVLAVLTVVAFVLPLRPSTSQRERRALREFPAFSVEALLSGDYFDGVTAWFSDTFPGRETMLGVSDWMDSLHGTNQNEVVLAAGGANADAGNDNADLDALLEAAEAAAAEREAQSAAQQSSGTAGNSPAAGSSGGEAPGARAQAEPASLPEAADQDAVIQDWEGALDEDAEAKLYGELVVIDGTVVSRMGFSQQASDRHVSLMNRGADALVEKGVRFFNLPAPTGISVLLSSEMVEQLGAADQGKTLRYMFAQENENVGKVNAFNNLLQHNDEYLYYHSDHHWTALGAYYAYEAFCQTAGFEPVPLSEYEEWNMGLFTGSWYYSVNNKKLTPDEMIAYVPPGNITMEISGHGAQNGVIVDHTDWPTNTKYDCFISGDNALTILTNNDLPDAPDCIVIKDSFGNPFSVYLTQHYHRVIVLDYRKNSEPITKTAEKYGVSDVILVQSIGVSQSLDAQWLLDNLLK